MRCDKCDQITSTAALSAEGYLCGACDSGIVFREDHEGRQQAAALRVLRAWIKASTVGCPNCIKNRFAEAGVDFGEFCERERELSQ